MGKFLIAFAFAMLAIFVQGCGDKETAEIKDPSGDCVCNDCECVEGEDCFCKKCECKPDDHPQDDGAEGDGVEGDDDSGCADSCEPDSRALMEDEDHGEISEAVYFDRKFPDDCLPNDSSDRPGRNRRAGQLQSV